MLDFRGYKYSAVQCSVSKTLQQNAVVIGWLSKPYKITEQGGPESQVQAMNWIIP